MEKTNPLIGLRIRRLRQSKTLSRQDVAERLRVDVTAVCGWEQGKYLPRDKHRFALAHTLGCNLDALFSELPDCADRPGAAELVDTMERLPELFDRLLAHTRRSLKALRLAAPYSTAGYVQQRFRTTVAERLLHRTLEVQRVEIFYELGRLKEALANIFRYNGCAYHVKSYCAGLREIAPAIGGYMFDDEEFLLGGYWTGVPPHGKPGLHLSGEPFRTFFVDYWNEIWGRGTLLNIRGAHDLSAVREVALGLGLAAQDWPKFVAETRNLEIGDGAPPLI